MPIFSKESLDTLRHRIDLVDVLSSHLDLKKSGASYKGLCPFHDEKSPSFMVQKGDSHYHCFGCGAHGDAIQFLMTHLKMSFSDAIESLAQRFQVPLQYVDSPQSTGPNKSSLKESLEAACSFFQFNLLHTPEGHAALEYLYKRGIDLDFIYRFRLGLAPSKSGMLRKMLHAKFIKDETMVDAGLISQSNEGRWRDFFQDRITFPICDATGAVIGFSARKYKEETYGGKYINTTETALFKKSRILFGLHHSRKRIAKERLAIIVEGQIDALRLIASGFNITVAGQGTAFGEGHVKELMGLGINQVYLSLDSDEAGQQATWKIGDLFQREGVEVKVIQLPKGHDPDSFLRKQGPEAFLELMKKSIDYLTFTVSLFSKKINLDSPAGKNELVDTISKQIRNWKSTLMIHESLKKLANLVKVPEELVGVGQDFIPNVYVKRSATAGLHTVDPNLIIESDFLRWILLAGSEDIKLIEYASSNLKSTDLMIAACRSIYNACLQCYQEGVLLDLLNIASRIENPDFQNVLSEILQKKINREKSTLHFPETVQKILDRNWMYKGDEIRLRIQSAQCSDEEVLMLVKEFDELKKTPPRAIPWEVIEQS